MHTPLLMILRAIPAVFFHEMRIYVCIFLLSLDEHSVYYSNEKKTASVCQFLLDNWA